MTTDPKDSPASPFGMPGAGNLHEVMDSMQKAWGFNAATPMTPTLDIDEIDRRLQDLSTISQWLSLNQNMLQSTIQTLQVQRATLAAIQSFGSAAKAKEAGDDDSDQASSVSPADVMQAFTKMFSPPQSATNQASSARSSAPGGTDSPSANSSSGAASPASGAHAAADPQQWWAMLQNQFAQVTNAALETQKAATRAATKKPASTKTAAKKATRKPAKPKSS